MKRIVQFLSKASGLAGEKRKLPEKAAIKNCVRQSVRTAAAIAGIVLMLTFFKTEIHENVVFLSVGGITAGELVENDGGDGVKMAIVCSEDPWAEPEGIRLSEKISASYDFYPEVVTEERFRESDYANYDLTVVIGHTGLSGACYLDEYSRLGEDGYEISPTDKGGKTVAVNLLAFSGTGARSASDRFISYFLSEERLFRSPDSLYVSISDTESVVPAVIRGKNTDVLSISVPGGDGYSLRALDAMLAKTSPSVVVFNGGLDCGKTDRTGISEAWTGISAVLEKHGVKFACTFSEDDETCSVGTGVLLEVVSSFPGYIGETAGSDPETVPDCRLIVLCDSENVKKTALFLINGRSAAEKRLDASVNELSRLEAILDRSIPEGLPVQVIAAGIPEKAADAIHSGSGSFTNVESMKPYELKSADKLLPNIISDENGCYIFSAGNTNTGTGIAALYGAKAQIALTGSLDFESPGLGGRFELNNSLRGGVLSTVSDGKISLRYVYAADLGVTGR